MKIPYFSRTQQGVLLLLGVALLLLWVWRANFGLPPSPPAAKPTDPVFVEVVGAAAHPGVCAFLEPPTLSEVWARAGVPGPAPTTDEKLSSGSRLEISQDGTYRRERMQGAPLLTLGLALDLNRATARDLEALPAIGPVLAQRIVSYREAHGPFKNIDDLQQVSGIGPKKLAMIKPYLILGQEAEPPDQE